MNQKAPNIWVKAGIFIAILISVGFVGSLILNVFPEATTYTKAVYYE
jgi:hypothetical protein